jgi:hypothetical protein
MLMNTVLNAVRQSVATVNNIAASAYSLANSATTVQIMQ